MGAEEVFEEVAGDLLYALDCGLYEGLQGELVDVAWLALGSLKDASGGVVGEEVLVGVDALQVESYVVAGVFEGKGPQAMGVSDSGAEGVEVWVSENSPDR